MILRFIVNAIALYLILKFVPGFDHNAGIGTALIAAIVFGIVNMLLGPILRLISAPITWLTHGLFSFVVNYLLFAIAAHFTPDFRSSGNFNHWLAYLYGTIVMMLVSTLMERGTSGKAAGSS